MDPSTDLTALLGSMEPVVRPGRFEFVTCEVPHTGLAAVAHAVVVEAEGHTYVVEEQHAPDTDAPAMGWITLTVHSSLDAVGLTAAFSTALGEAGISCNVIAGFHHDHLLVPFERVDEAVAVLRQLQESAASTRSMGA